MFIKRSLKIFVIVMIVFVLTAVSYAFAAANTLPGASLAGDGNVTVSGITVTNIKYAVTLTANPTTSYVTGVTLTLATATPATTSIQVKLVAAGTTWYTCTNTGTTTVTCDTSSPAVTITAVDNLRVIALDQ
jgi:hypothetical protein